VSAAERDKWDKRYRAGAYEERTHPTALLAEWLPRLGTGSALDLACGAGRNALFLAANGYRVDALDISSVGLERGRHAAGPRQLAIRWLCADLDEPAEAALPAGPYDLIVWVRYIHRDLMPYLLARLSPGGTLLCEQHLATTDTAVAGPTNAAFRLEPGELVRSAPGLQVRHHYEGAITDPDGRRVMLTQLVGTAAG
jgi:SAM-dependent methyltransferase